MQLHQLKYFVAVVETGSVTKAAKQCFISQPSISQQLKKLEDNVDKKLFEWVNQKLHLTDAGRIMYEQAAKILSDVEETKVRMRRLDQSYDGKISIGVIPTISPFILPVALKNLSREYPGSIIRVKEEVSDNIQEACLRGELDLIVTSAPLESAGFDIELTMTDQYYLAVNADDPLAKKKTVTIDEIQMESFILLEDIHCLSKQIQHFCFNHNFVPKVMFQATQIDTINKLIDLNYGISIVPELAFDHSKKYNISYLKIDGDEAKRDVIVAAPKGRERSHICNIFIDIVKQSYYKRQFNGRFEKLCL